MPLIAAGKHYGAMRILTPKIFPVAADLMVPARQPAAWWKGEDNFIDTIQPGIDLFPWNSIAVLDPRFTDGIVGRCFIVDSLGFWDSLGIGEEPATQAKTNISSFGIWELEMYLKLDSATGWFYIFQAYDIFGGDYIAVSLYANSDSIDVANQDTGIGDPYPLWESLGLPIGEWFKVRLKYTKATHQWELYINDVLKTPSGTDVMPVNEHDYYTFFMGEDWNSPVLNVDEIKIYTETSS